MVTSLAQLPAETNPTDLLGNRNQTQDFRKNPCMSSRHSLLRSYTGAFQIQADGYKLNIYLFSLLIVRVSNLFKAFKATSDNILFLKNVTVGKTDITI